MTPETLAYAFTFPILGIFLGLVYKGIDRRISARLTSRIGPPIRQPFWDVGKLLLKETVVPENAVAGIFNAMPIVAFASSMTLLLYIPFGVLRAPLEGYGDLIVILYLLTLQSLTMAIGGFASGSPFSSIGAQREMVLMMSYEMPLATVIVGFALVYRSFSLTTIATTPVWSLTEPLAAIGILLLFAALLVVTPAELAKLPFDIAEAETEICEGMLAEYSGRNLALFYLSDAVRGFAMAALEVVLFLPFTLDSLINLGLTGWAYYTVEALWFLFKVMVIYLLAITLVRTSFARFRIEQASRIFWIYVNIVALVGLALVWMGV
ncbi:NADH-quinone oxidoreductase subunit H [Thermococcus sp. LS1]|uniref:respiratory chain complex I subunit 1 family protein n=1 Tax=Thermococcus sp. LS1 TaxID=1638259 RepID=UPI001439A663|nr:complex I subunit 1 family protein [Thermococcus sp. LS1]NJD98620.1 NADH-quinone oxidoreductase subunit H [Thermococcus sp. LS1]